MKELNYSSVKTGEKFYSNFHLKNKLIEKFKQVIDDNMQISEIKKVPNYMFSLYKPIHEAIGSAAQGTIHVQQKMEHFSDAWIGDHFDVVVTVKDKYRKKQRDFLMIEVDFIRGNQLICRHETTHIWALTKGEE